MPMLVLLAACSSTPEPAASPPVEASASEAVVPTPAAPLGPQALPEPLRTGVTEVVTPPEILRLTEHTEQVPPRHLEVRVDFSSGDFATVKADVERWGFKVEDGDGASLRLVAPEGDGWADRLEPLPTIARVTETLTQDKLPDGAVRAGTAKFATVAYSWSLKDGELVERVEGGKAPLAPEIPRSIPVSVVRCLSPLRTAMLDGESAGPGWERAIDPANRSWVLVLEHFGACDATGWLVARADAKVDTLTVAEKPLKSLDDAALFAAATRYLSVERAASDESAAAAVDILRRADDEKLKAAITGVSPGPHQERLLLALAQRSEAEAVGFAGSSTSPTVRGWAAGVDATARAAVLADPKSAPEALVSAMSAWRPGTGDGELVARLKANPDPRVRMRVWDLTIDAGSAACTARVPSAKTASMDEAKKLYAECPQAPVRLQAFSRLAQLDKAVATEVISATLQNPETVRTGIGAVRAANSLERDDLLEAVVANVAVDRDVRAEALRTLLRVGRSAKAPELAEKHGPFLGVKPADLPAVADGPGRKPR